MIRALFFCMPVFLSFAALAADADSPCILGAGDVLRGHFDCAAHRHILRLRVSFRAAAAVDIALQQTCARRRVGSHQERCRNGEDG